MAVAAKVRVRPGQVWSATDAKGKVERYVRVESVKGAVASCVERYSPVGRFSSLTLSIPVSGFRRPKFVLCRDAE